MWRQENVEKDEEKNLIEVDVERVKPEVREEFLCPLCRGEMVPPMEIWQCLEGHIVCGICREKTDIQVRLNKIDPQLD